ncbi:hypothetical protein K3G39_08340 [Pontibacter sp. HSC-14F20]|uniref:ATP-grasp domain-containing protein n=1 Tax=Pontibacter sp. HSC-14F20 TaxID=2864136 RepID=UPI001C7369DC|nr:hypothetical protein [Pontibacter sp. HSC-14F20]MBX0333245.1 hypothetical protein [Pontibacter sp. HSC-14F20]
MIIAIHPRVNSFTDEWIQYCIDNSISYKIVNCYSSNIINDLCGCSALMWHWDQSDEKAILFARQLTFSLEAAGITVYPNVNTVWHFDDKIGQKYLLEAIEAPFVTTHIHYDVQEALAWIDKSTFPKVFKLRRGATSTNVSLTKTPEAAKKQVKRSFKQGFNSINRVSIFQDKLDRFKKERSITSFKSLLKGFVRIFVPTQFERIHGKEKGYIYFQDFIPGNNHDTRVVIVGNKAFSIIRYNRKDDFRASGSGHKSYDPALIDPRCLQIAFEVSEKLGMQSCAFDFILDTNNNPLIIEISYGFVTKIFPGYWDKDLVWHEGETNIHSLIIETFLQKELMKK